jgi:hypothetical protein
MENGKRKKEVRGMMAGRIFSVAVFCLFITLTSQAQNFWEWSDPAPLTDSLHNHGNMHMSISYENGEALFMTWERSTDPVSTSIMFNNFLDGIPPIEVLADSGIHYTSPRIMDSWYFPESDSLLFLFYISDQGGKKDIYYTVYLDGGTFTTPALLINSAGDESELVVGDDVFWKSTPYVINTLAYTRNDSLFAVNLMKEGNSIYLDDEALVDAPGCSNPALNGSGSQAMLNYLKADTSELHIFQAVCNWVGNWSVPEIFYDSNNCRNLSRALHYGNFIWSAYKDSSWRIMIDWPWSTDLFSTYPLSSDSAFEPAALGMVIAVKSWSPDDWVAIPYPDNGVDEIYMTEWAGSPVFLDFTNSGTMNRNPQTFVGESAGSYYCWYDYLVWESYRNGHWQIWYSRFLQCAGNIAEEDMDADALSIHPNPFSSETNIGFTLEEEGSVQADVFNNQGEYITTLINRSCEPGTHQLRWSGEGLATGIYLVRMSVNGKIYTAKVIKE